MSGSAFIDKTGNGQRVFYLDSTNFGPTNLNFPIDFLASQTGTGRLQFKIITGSFYISDISLKSGIDQGFNPSNFNSYFPINVKNRNDVYDFKVDFIDDNNQINSYEFDNTGAVNIQVSGSNQYISGNDNLLPGRLNLGESSNSGISLNGSTNTISTHGYQSGSGWVFWSGSQSISGSTQPGSGFYFETGPPYNHYIKAVVGGQVEMSGSVSGGGGTTIDTGSFVKTGSFNEFTSSINSFTSSISSSISSINNFTSSINNVTSSFTTTSSFNNFTSSINSSISSINNFTSSINNFTSSINNKTGSFVTTSSFNSYTSSVQSAINSIGGKANLNGGNSFSGDQTISGSVEFTSVNSYISSNIKFTDISETSPITLYQFSSDRFRGAFGDIMITDQADPGRLEIIHFSIALQYDNAATLSLYNIVTSSGDLSDVVLSTDIVSHPNVNIVATISGGNVYTFRVSNVHLLNI
jgi:hypothetical protein